jgi:cytochrome c5
MIHMPFRIATALALVLFIGNVIATAQSSPGPVAAAQQKPEDKLPEGEGKKILLTACSECHAVSEVTKFAGIYDLNEWRDLVKSMIVYGAQVTAEEENVLVDYLDTHFGKK